MSILLFLIGLRGEEGSLFIQAEDGMRDSVASRALGDVYKIQQYNCITV